mmetsp:Transcript_39958/g.95354  ORF Transcript_39958/g.95354 Transcript_39958/m.95354 type:complete len:318 (+) Transcript_39958:2209-3162(+)
MLALCELASIRGLSPAGLLLIAAHGVLCASSPPAGFQVPPPPGARPHRQVEDVRAAVAGDDLHFHLHGFGGFAGELKAHPFEMTSRGIRRLVCQGRTHIQVVAGSAGVPKEWAALAVEDALNRRHALSAVVLRLVERANCAAAVPGVLAAALAGHSLTAVGDGVIERVLRCLQQGRLHLDPLVADRRPVHPQNGRLQSARFRSRQVLCHPTQDAAVEHHVEDLAIEGEAGIAVWPAANHQRHRRGELAREAPAVLAASLRNPLLLPVDPHHHAEVLGVERHGNLHLRTGQLPFAHPEEDVPGVGDDQQTGHVAPKPP